MHPQTLWLVFCKQRTKNSEKRETPQNQKCVPNVSDSHRSFICGMCVLCPLHTHPTHTIPRRGAPKPGLLRAGGRGPLCGHRPWAARPLAPRPQLPALRAHWPTSGVGGPRRGALCPVAEEAACAQLPELRGCCGSRRRCPGIRFLPGLQPGLQRGLRRRVWSPRPPQLGGLRTI